MNTPPTAPPKGSPSLDHFETALLGELKEHVATRPAGTPVRERPRRRKRVAVGIAAAAAAATAYVVVSPGGPAVSPAYAVSQEADGDVVVTVHRLEDSEGLERALAEHGIEADVSFSPTPNEHGYNTFELGPFGAAEDPPPGESGKSFDYEAEGEEPGAAVDQAIPGQVPDLPDCGDRGAEPATLTHEGADWVLRIPADSPAQDRPIVISTASDGGLMVAFEANDPGAYCAFMSVGENG